MRRWLAPAIAAGLILMSGTAAMAHEGLRDTVISDPGPVTTWAGATGLSALAATGQVSCVGDGTSGKRVQILYLRETSQTDRLSQYKSPFQQWATDIDQDFVDSGEGNFRHVRWAHDRLCMPTVTTVVVPNGTLSNYATTLTAIRNAGYNRTDRKYLGFAETGAWCGLAGGGTGADDDRPTSDNRYNTGADLATVGSGCWGWAPAGHELLHTLGAVVATAPHATSNGHCWDDEDIMCYDDGGIPNPPGAIVKVCAGAPENLIDCNHDDYYSTKPVAGSWLATHWNVANSQFLISSEPLGAVPAAASDYTEFATPVAALDTRNGTGAAAGKRGAGSITSFPVLGVGGIPTSGVTSVQVRVAVGSASAATFLDVWPSGTPDPGLSMINVDAAENISTVAVVPVGADGRLLVYNSAGTADIVIDVQGYFSTAAGGGFTPVMHTRLIDTRSGLGTSTGTIPAGGSRTVTLTGGVLPAGATTAYVNLLVPSASTAGWLAAAPPGTASGLGVLNYSTGSTQSGATLKLSASGQVTFYNKGTSAINLVVVGEGSYGASASSGLELTPASIRLINTRTAGSGTPIPAGGTLDVQVAGVNGVPATAVAAALNITITTPQVGGWLKAWPVGATEPSVTLQDFTTGVWRASGLTLTLGTNGTIRIKNGSTGTVHMIVDLQGWYADSV